MPCRNCAALDIPCEIRESRRGKHPRNQNRLSVGGSNAANAEGHRLVSAIQRHNADQVEASEVLASLSRPATLFNPQPEWNEAAKIPASGTTISVSPEESRQEDDGAVFLGESTSIRYVHEESETSPMSGPTPDAVRFRHSVPSAARAENMVPVWEVERRRSRINYLKADGAFTIPAKPVLDALLGAYFKWFHPCFAIVDESDVWEQHRRGVLSPLLLQAMLFIGVVHCDKDKLKELGLGIRHRAKYIYYNRAKDLYDADFESKKLVVIQALFLLSFWRAGALFEKDVRHWIGAAISLALTKALHRSSGGAVTPLSRLYKRLWWSIYVRERQAAAALGLPNRVRDDDMDIESLEKADFAYAFDPETSSDDAEAYISYQISITGLARTLGRVVHSGYLPQQQLSPQLISQLKDELINWKHKLPPAMQLDNDFGNKPGFLANMLHLSYNNVLILLYRSGYIGSSEENPEVDGGVALQAAARNSRIIEDMLPEGNLCHAQIHVITNLFNTLCIHTLNLQRSEGTARAIAEHRAKICLMGLQEIQKTWEVTNWVLQLFFQYLDRSTAARLQMPDDTLPRTSVTETNDEPQAQRTIPLSTPMLPLDLNGMPRMGNGDDFGTAAADHDTPWSWTTEEANSFLFSQIENDFSFKFGEGGGIFDWNSGETLSSVLAPFDEESKNL